MPCDFWVKVLPDMTAKAGWNEPMARKAEMWAYAQHSTCDAAKVAIKYV
jgi:hypothetical protein